VNGYLIEEVFVGENEEFTTTSHYTEREHEIGDTISIKGESYVVVQVL